MASLTFKPLQQTQLQLSSFSHCTYYSTVNTFKFHFSSDSPTISLPKHTLTLQLNARVAGRSETGLYGDIKEQHSRDNVSNDKSKRSASYSVERKGVGVVEHIEKRVIHKDRHARAQLNSNRRKDVESGVPSTRSNGNDDGEINDKTRNSKNVNNGVKVEQKGKRMRKPKFHSPGGTLKIGLEMCSKRGDILGAINLYDLARKEGIELEQYHYAVLLYLCSSAATGVIRPAKSGNRSRSLSSGDSLNGTNTDAGSGSISEFGEMLRRVYGRKDKVEKVEFNKDFGNGSAEINDQTVADLVQSMKNNTHLNHKVDEIKVSEDVKRIALQRGFEIYSEMRNKKVPMNEATLTSVARVAMTFGDGEMAFDIVKQMKEYGINPKLRSYSPALAIFCSNGDIESAFKVEKHMVEHGVFPEEPELEALLKVSLEARKSDKVYYVFHKLRTSVRQVSLSTADLIEGWFKSTLASRVGKRKCDQELVSEAMESGGGGWHGTGWLGKGKWTVCRSPVGSDGLCKSCGEKLVTIDLNPLETDTFAKLVAHIAAQREKNSGFQKFQRWLDHHGPFEAVVDAANIGLYTQGKFKPSKVNAVLKGIRQILPSKKWPLIVLHNRHITGTIMRSYNRSFIEKWKDANVLYATPTGSNDDWYWLYAAIKFKCLIVTNDEMRDHLFQLLGNDFFPRWKERHQVRFTFTETSPVFHMPPPCSVVIQESEKGHWHIPIASELESEEERTWLCCTRSNSSLKLQKTSDTKEGNHMGETKTYARAKDQVL